VLKRQKRIANDMDPHSVCSVTSRAVKGSKVKVIWERKLEDVSFRRKYLHGIWINRQ